MTRALCHFDNAYWLPDVAMHGYSGKTNTQSNTAFRGFGGPQGAIAIENILDIDRAHARPRSARRAPRQLLRQRASATSRPTARSSSDNIIHELVAELEASSDYRARRAAIAAFNATSPVLKRGLALTPVKFGISFNVDHLNQAGALVHVYTDGSMLVNHGGTEMGQGLNTKVAQVVAHELGVELRARARHRDRHAEGRQHLGHRGVDRRRPERQGRAGRGAPDPRAARRLRRRAPRRRRRRTCASPTTRSSVNGQHAAASRRWSREAYLDRVQLWSDGFYATPGLSWDTRHDAGPAVLLLRLRRGGERGRRRHAHRRMEAAARRHPARRRHAR